MTAGKWKGKGRRGKEGRKRTISGVCDGKRKRMKGKSGHSRRLMNEGEQGEGREKRTGTREEERGRGGEGEGGERVRGEVLERSGVGEEVGVGGVWG